MKKQEMAAADSDVQFDEHDGIITVSEICERLGLIVSSDLLTRFGFVPAANINNEKLYRTSDFKSICDALEFHICFVRDMK